MDMDTMNLDMMDTDWIEEYENEDSSYDLFYPVTLSNIKVNILYVNNRNELRKKFISKGIFCTIFDKFWNFIPKGEEIFFPNTDKILKNILILPVSYKSKKNETYKMIEIINNI